jgi:hypothetical protein
VVPVPVCDAIEVALPTDVIGPVKLAFVVTLPEVRLEAVPVTLVITPEAGVPSAGVTRVGEVANTADPEPVSLVSAVFNCDELNDPNTAAFPTEVICPVRLAFVVTLPAVKLDAVPVILVPTNAEGVPRAGVTRVGEVANTSTPEPVSSEITPFSCSEVVAANTERLFDTNDTVSSDVAVFN